MDEVSQIRGKIDLVSLISEHIPLKKMGRNFKANCPFHGEKTPSFVVSPERQIWHCFGCSKGGDAYSFLMQYENLEFPEALRILAKKAGIELIESSGFDKGVSSKKEKIFKLNHLAMEFYHFLLTKHQTGKKALFYLLNERKINKGLIETFKIGFAPSARGSLSNYLISKKGYSREDLIDAGLAFARGRDVLDFFYGRIIFPLFDHRGNVLGFSGRLLVERDDAGKYVNTRETLVYHKGEVFFGLNLAKEEIKKEGFAIITEGEFDVISAFGEGIKNVIAVKGTALTENQAMLLSRFCQRVTLSFDTDKAGQEAVKRSLLVLEKKGFTVNVALLTNGKDIDESLKNDPVIFKKEIKRNYNVYDFLLEKAVKEENVKTAEGKKKIADGLLPFYIQIENEIVKEHYLKKLAENLQTSLESVEKQGERMKKPNFQSQKSTDPKTARSREEILEEYLAGLLLQAEDKKNFSEKAEKILLGFLPKLTADEKLIGALFYYFKENDVFDDKKFIEVLPLEILDSYNKAFLLPLALFKDKESYLSEIEKASNDLKVLYLKAKIRKISEKIKEKEKENPRKEEELDQLKKDMEELMSQLKIGDPIE